MENKEFARNCWNDLCSGFNIDETQRKKCWEELVSAYSAESRHYHNLDHIFFMLREATRERERINDHEVFLFSIFYHDIVYSATAGDNEEKSAEKAVEVLNGFGMDPGRVKLCSEQIIATKKHDMSPDADTNLLLDMDMAILGQAPGVYDSYTANVRKEYSIYPDLLYRPGRKKVLKHFLEMERIFKTELYYDRYEEKARANIRREIEGL